MAEAFLEDSHHSSHSEVKREELSSLSVFSNQRQMETSVASSDCSAGASITSAQELLVKEETQEAQSRVQERPRRTYREIRPRPQFILIPVPGPSASQNNGQKSGEKHLKDNEAGHCDGIRTPPEGQPYSCALCSYETKYRHNYLMHKKFHPSGLNCTQCTYKAPSLADIERHLFSHSVKRAHECSHCPFKTAFRSTLEVHMRLHNMVSYICQRCGYKLHRKSIFDKHIKNCGRKSL